MQQQEGQMQTDLALDMQDTWQVLEDGLKKEPLTSSSPLLFLLQRDNT